MTINNQSIDLDARQILLKRGNSDVSSVYVGPIGEITLDTTLNTLRVHNGVTPGGVLMTTEAMTRQYVFNAFNANVEPLVAQSVALIAANLISQINQVTVGIVNLTTSVNNQIDQLVGNVVPGLETLEEIALSLDSDPALAANLRILIASVQTNLNSETVRALAAEDALQSNIAAEAAARITVAASLQSNLNTESNARSSADTVLQSNINTEITDRTNADISLQANIAAEIAARTDADANLQTQIAEILSNFDANVIDSFSEIVTSIGTEASDRSAADLSLQANIAAEATARITQGTSLQSNIAAEVTRATAAEGVLTTDLSALDNSLATVAKTGSYTDLVNAPDFNSFVGNITPSTDNTQYLGTANNRWHSIFVGPGSVNIGNITLSQAPDGKVTTNQPIDLANSNINWTNVTDTPTSLSYFTNDPDFANVTYVDTSVNSEATRAIAAEGVLTANLAAEAVTRAADDIALQNSIIAEATARQDADQQLQLDIDAEATARTAADLTNANAIGDETIRASAVENSIINNVAALQDSVASLSSGFGNINTAASITSNITSITAGATIQIAADYANPLYPSGVFTVFQLDAITLTATAAWASGSAAKDAYTDFVANAVNTQNINITLSLGAATFAVTSSDTITIGGTVITGADLLALGITGTGGTYTIPAAKFAASNQTVASVAVSVNLTTTRGNKTATATTLTNAVHTPYAVTFASAAFPAATVPYWNLNQTFSWAATVTGTTASGNVTYSGGASGTLSTIGAASGTSPSLDSTLAYTISSSDYKGAGLRGAGTRTISATITRSITPATKYYPLFRKVTTSSANPIFTTSDPRNTINYVLGQGANTTASASDYNWIAIPDTAAHTFGFLFLGTTVTVVPDQTYTNQDISGYTYTVYGFTNYSAVTNIFTLS